MSVGGDRNKVSYGPVTVWERWLIKEVIVHAGSPSYLHLMLHLLLIVQLWFALDHGRWRDSDFSFGISRCVPFCSL